MGNDSVACWEKLYLRENSQVFAMLPFCTALYVRMGVVEDFTRS